MLFFATCAIGMIMMAETKCSIWMRICEFSMAHNSYIYKRKIRRFKENINSFSLLATSYICARRLDARFQCSRCKKQYAFELKCITFYISLFSQKRDTSAHFKSFISIFIPRTYSKLMALSTIKDLRLCMS